jgi:diacylglycerol kinase (ATP)
MTSRRVLFIVNPNAGKKISGNIIEFIKIHFPSSINYDIEVWKNPDHFSDILKTLHSSTYTDAVAVGGDGTVNQVAKSLLGTDIALGIVPIGSGNGLARSLGLSMNLEMVLKELAVGKKEIIDYGLVNQIPFFCTSGMGFDAHIGHLFATSPKRGLKNYIRISVSEFGRYKAKSYTLKINGQTLQRDAFLITVANAGQYGNDVYIAPQASMQDGVFHIAIVQPLSLSKSVGLLGKVLRKKTHTSAVVETFTASELQIIREDKDILHFDGEPILGDVSVNYQLISGGLQVIVGGKW